MRPVSSVGPCREGWAGSAKCFRASHPVVRRNDSAVVTVPAGSVDAAVLLVHAFHQMPEFHGIDLLFSSDVEIGAFEDVTQ